MVSSDIPVTVQRYTGDATLPARGGCEGHPLEESEGIILVTSDCDTSVTTITPKISLVKTAQSWGDPKVTSIIIDSGALPEAAATMDFLEETSSHKMEISYNGCTELYCGENPWETPNPVTRPPQTPSPMQSPQSTIEGTACLTEADCDKMRQQMAITNFQVGNYPSKGCFTKKGIAYWGSGGSVDDRSRSNLPGVQERIWCDNNADNPIDDPISMDIACLTEKDCDEQRQEIGIANFYRGDYRTKGCFIKNGKSYFSAGSVVDMSEADLPGVQERIWCRASNTNSRVSNTNPVSALQQIKADSREATGATNSAISPGSIVFSLVALLTKSAYSKTSTGSEIRQDARALDSCTYNVEIFVNGCSDRLVEVYAPKVRVADADADFTEVITPIDELYSEFKETVDFSFPNEGITNFSAPSDKPVAVGGVDGYCDCCICIGRPFVDVSGNVLQATPSFATDHTSSWSGATSVVNDECKLIEDAPTENELILGKEWRRNALGEHASVASFSAFSISLMTNSAPSDLVEDALKAGLDEIRHAKISFEIASKLAGKNVGPGPLPKSTHMFQHNLTEMAMALAREGCVDETLSALVAVAEAEAISTVLETGTGMTKYLNVTDSTLIWLKDELHKIALDESNHSALAWRSLKWVCSVDDKVCNAVYEAVLEEKKLAFAFHRRFSSINVSDRARMKLMEGWRQIYTVQNVFHLSSNDTMSERVCINSDSNATSLLASVVDNALRSVTRCNNVG